MICFISLYFTCKHAQVANIPSCSSNLYAQLAEVLLVRHALACLLELGQLEDLFVDDGVDVVLLDGGVHGFELEARAYE